MATHPITGGAERPSNPFAAALSLIVAAAIGSAPLWALLLAA